MHCGNLLYLWLSSLLFAHGSHLGQLVDLLVCEKKLITIDVKNDALDSLRKRQYALFVAFIKRMKVEKSKGVYNLYMAGIYPLELIEINLNVKSVVIIHNIPADAEKRMCSKCKIVRPTAAFEIHTRQLDVNVCKSCNRLKVTWTVVIALHRHRRSIIACVFLGFREPRLISPFIGPFCVPYAATNASEMLYHRVHSSCKKRIFAKYWKQSGTVIRRWAIAKSAKIWGTILMPANISMFNLPIRQILFYSDCPVGIKHRTGRLGIVFA